MKVMEHALCDVVGTFAADFKAAVLKKYKQIPEEDLTDLIKECITKRTDNPDVILGRVAIKRDTKTMVDPVTGEIRQQKGCQFILIRGPRAGQKCDKVCTMNSEYCSTHKRSVAERSSSLQHELSPFKKIPGVDDAFVYNDTQLVVTRASYNYPLSITNCEVIGTVNKGWQLAEKVQFSKELSTEDVKFAEERGMKIGVPLTSDGVLSDD
ncbi:hypothetical protein IWQ61_009334 [Dispira simplex]|nr:hypothetical protein IWQ61_009334 [Dispira simplex]